MRAVASDGAATVRFFGGATSAGTSRDRFFGAAAFGGATGADLRAAASGGGASAAARVPTGRGTACARGGRSDVEVERGT